MENAHRRKTRTIQRKSWETLMADWQKVTASDLQQIVDV